MILDQYEQIVKPHVITLGPCGGKTSIIPLLIETLTERDRDVYPLPEMASYLESLRIHPKYGTSLEEYQKHIIRFQLLHEQAVQRQIATVGRPDRSVVLCDRGLIDNIAYVGKSAYEKLLKPFDLSLEDIYTRYAGALGLQTAAYGAEQFYTTKNNKARKETIAEAREVEDKLLEAYDDFLGKRFFVGNTAVDGTQLAFEEKKKQAKNAFLRQLGEPPIEFERQWEVRAFDRKKFSELNTRRFHIRQHYLPMHLFDRPDFDEARIRHMQDLTPGVRTSDYYFFGLKKRQGKARLEEEKVITKSVFDQYFPNRIPEKSKYKDRYVFRNPLDNHRYEFDLFQDEGGNENGKSRLEAELPSEEILCRMPSFILDAFETTGDPAYSNAVRA